MSLRKSQVRSSSQGRTESLRLQVSDVFLARMRCKLLYSTEKLTFTCSILQLFNMCEERNETISYSKREFQPVTGRGRTRAYLCI